MPEIYFTSDLHFGHRAVLHYDDRPFHSVEEMDAEIIKRWNNKVKKYDLVYILGDISWYNQNKTIELIKQLNGTLYLIKGNHDRISPELRKCFKEIWDYKEIKVDGRDVILCHYPIPCFNKHFYGSYMLYGHVHNSHEWNYMKHFKREMEAIDVPCNMFNVGCMIWNYEPVTLNEIIAATSKNKKDIKEQETF